ncbi:MAG: DUF192 domain-containing protein [Burkholderiaceae bacterium]
MKTRAWRLIGPEAPAGLAPDDDIGVLTLAIASDFIERLLGLFARPPLGAGDGLWIKPCRAVHSFGMRARIDLIFIDRHDRIVAIRHGLRPWRVAICVHAHSVVELRDGEARRLRIVVGARLVPDR